MCIYKQKPTAEKAQKIETRPMLWAVCLKRRLRQRSSDLYWKAQRFIRLPVKNKKQKTASSRLLLFWWRRVDSNHRRRCQQIYSLPPLATRELLPI